MKDIKIIKSITNRDCDSISMYFKEIYKYQPLSSEEEIALASNKTKENLNKLVLHNLRFVITVAKQYQGQGLNLEDLINEGNIGLCKAANKYNPDKGVRFISYAVWWIRQSIIAAIYTNSRTIKSPTSFIVLLNRIKRTIADFISEFNREPSLEELSELLNLSEDKISDIISKSTNCVSLDSPNLDDNDSSTLVDIIENTDVKSPDEDLEKNMKLIRLKKVIYSLPERYSTVLIEHFGLFGVFPKSFDEIGKKMNLTGERVRQIKNDAINKLRQRYGKKLYELLSN